MADTQINVGMNVDGVITGTEKAKRSLKDLGGAASDAGRSVGGMGDGGKQSADKVEQSTRSMINSIQRQIAATEAGDKSTRAYQESLARMRGIDAGALKPYLDQLDSAKSKAQLAGVANESFAASFAGIRNAAMIAAAAVGAFSVAFKKINDGVDALNDLKDATGASIENISALEDVALRSGASFDTVSTSLIKFNGILKDAKQGSDAANAMKALGLSVEDFKRLDPAEALRQTAVAMNSFADDGNKARLAQELFGKSLKDVAPFLKDLAEQGKLVATVTTQQAEEAEKFNKELFQMGKNAQDLAREFTGPMVTAINEVILKFKEGRAAGQGFFAVGWQNYKDGISDFYGVKKSENGASGSWDNGASGSWGEADKPSAPQLPDTAALKAVAAAAKAAAAEANRELKEQAKLLAELSGLTGSFSEDWDRLSTIYKNGKLSLEGLTKAQADLLSKQPAIKAAKDAEAKAVETATKAYQESEKEHARYIESLSKGAEKFTADAKAQQDRNDRLGLSKEAIADLDAAELELQATKLDGLAIDELVSKHDEIAYQSLVDQAAMLRKLAVLKSQGATKEAGIDAAKKVNEEWKKGWEETDKIARDAFVGWAEGGISMAESIGKSLKKALLSAIYEATIRPIALAIYSSVVGGGSGAGGSAMGVVNGISAANTAYGMYSTGLSGTVGSSVGAAFGATAGNTALGMTQGLGYASSSLAANTASTAGANYAAVQAGGSAAGGSSAFSTVTPYAYIAAAMMANSSLYDAGYKWQDKAAIADPGMGLTTNLLTGLGMSDKGASILTGNAIEQAIFSKVMGLFTGPQAAETMGAAQGTFDAKGKMTASQAIDVGQSDAMIKTATERANILAQSYYSMAENLGIKAIESTFGFNSNTGEEGQHHNVDFRVNAGSAAYKSGEIDKNDTAAVTLAASRAVMTALQASELPRYLSGVFDGLTASTATQEQIDGVTKLAESYKGFHDQLQALPFEYLRDMSYKAAAGLVAAAGTMENLGSLLGGYYEAFYTSEEKKAQLTKNTTAAFEKLGIVMPALDESARAWYRSEVDRLGAMDMSVAANASAYTSILSLSGAMNTLVPALEDTAKTATATAESLAAANAKILKSSLDAATTGASDAMSALARAVDAQKSQIEAAYTAQADAINASLSSVAGSIGKLQSLSDSLKSTLDGMQISGSDTQYRAAAQAQISAALATARSGGGLPLDGQLTAALATVGKPSEKLFGTFTDYARDFYKTANDISSLGDLTGQQLTADQTTQAILNAQLSSAEANHTASIAALDGLLSNAQLQLDAANGLDVSVVSVADALLALSVSIGNLVTERTAQDLKAAGDSKAAAYFDANKDVKAAYADNSYGLGATDYANVHYGLYGKDENRASPVASTKGKSYFEIYPDVAAAFAANSYGLSQVEYSARHFANFGKDEKRTYPGFAQGINYVPQDMTVRIHEGEAIVPKVYNPYNPNAQQSGNNETAAALRELADRLDRIEANTRATAGHTAGTDRKLARVIPGNALITEAA